MKTITYKQLAFILDIKPVEALEKIIIANCHVKNIEQPVKGYRVSDYLYKGSDIPAEYDVRLLAEHLNLPDLESAMIDIRENYLKRQGTKRYILCDYPEKELKTKLKADIKIPSVLASLLKPEDVETIQSEWFKRYGITTGTLIENGKNEI